MWGVITQLLQYLTTLQVLRDVGSTDRQDIPRFHSEQVVGGVPAQVGGCLDMIGQIKFDPLDLVMWDELSTVETRA